MPQVVPADELPTIAGRVTRSLRNRLISADSDTSRSSTPVNELSPISEKEKQKTRASPKTRATRKDSSQAEATTPSKSVTRGRRASLSEAETKSPSIPARRNVRGARLVSEDEATTSSRTRSRQSPLIIVTPIMEENEILEIESSSKKPGRPRKLINDKGSNQEAQNSNLSLKSKKANSSIVESDVIINLDSDEEKDIKSPQLTSSEVKKAPSSDEKSGNKKMMIKLKKIILNDEIQEHERNKKYDSETMKNNENLEQTGKEDKNTIIIEKAKSETKSINESEKGDEKKDAEEEIPLYAVENTNKNNVTQIEENENILISQKENEKQNEIIQTADKDKGQEDVEKLKSVLEESIVNKDDNTQEDLNVEKSKVVEDTEKKEMGEADKDDLKIDSNATEHQDFENDAVDSESKDLKKDKERNMNSPEAQNKILQEVSDSYLTEQSEKNTTKDSDEDKDKSKKQPNVTFGTNKTDKISKNYPETPLIVKSKSTISLRFLDTSHDTDTGTEISALSKESNEKSQENSNSEKIDETVFHDSETPYKGGKSSLLSSTLTALLRNQIKDNKNVENLKQDKTSLPNPITEDSLINEAEEPTTTLKEDIKKTSKSDTLKAAADSTFQKENKSKRTEYEFSKTWSQSVTVNVTDDAQKGKYIDGFGVQTEDKKEVKTTKLSGEKKAPERTFHSDSESYEESDIDEDNEPRNEFIDDEAEEAEEENSLCSEERAYLEENEVPVDGISIGSADTDADNEEEEDECDSFIVSDREEDDDLLSYDTEEIFSNSDDNSVKQRKQRRRAVLLLESSDESDADVSKPDMMNSVLKKTKKLARILMSSDEEEKCEKDSVIPSTAASEQIDRMKLILEDSKIALETISEDNETSKTSDINKDTENVDECISAELVADGNTIQDLGSAKESESKNESTQVDIIKITSTTQTSPESEKEGNDIKLLEASQPSSFIQGGSSLDENAQEKESTVEKDCTNKETNRKLSFPSEQQSNSISPNNSANLPASTAGQNANISILNVNESSLSIQENITETFMSKSKQSELLANIDVEEEDSSVSTSKKSRKSQSTSSKNPAKDIQNDKSNKVSSPYKEHGLKPSEKKQTETTNTEDELEQKKTLEVSASNKEISSSNEELEQREQPSTSTLNNEEETTSVLNSAEVNEKDVADVNIQSSFKNNSLDLLRKGKLFPKHKVLSSSFGSNSQNSTDSEEDISIKPVQKKLKRSSLSQSLNQSVIPETNQQTDTNKSSTDEQNEISSLSEEEARLIQHIEKIKKKRTEKQIEKLSIENLQIPEDKEKRKAISKALEFGMFLLKKQVVDLTTVAKCGDATPSELALINRTRMKLKKLKKAKGLANDECLLQQESEFSDNEKNKLKIKTMSNAKKQKERLLPYDILEAIDTQHKRSKKPHVDDSEGIKKLKTESRSESNNKKKISRSSATGGISDIIKNPSGIFFEEPITPEKKHQRKSFKNEKRKILSTIELPTGVVYERPVTPVHQTIVNGFKETAATPKAIGFKVKSILSAGQKEPPVYKKDTQKRRKLILDEPTTVLPKPKWAASGEFTVTKYPKPIDIDESIATEFLVTPLQSKRSKMEAGIAPLTTSAAYDFKKDALYNKQIPRETSKQLLQRKEKQKFYMF